MAAFAARIRNLLKQNGTPDPAGFKTGEQQIRAVDALIDGLQSRTVKVTSTDADLDLLITRLKTVRARLEDIDARLKLAVRCGNISTSIH